MYNSLDNSVIGKVGLVMARISNKQKGELRIGIGGGSEDYLAISANLEDVFEINSTAIVVELRLPRTVVVSKISSF